MQIDGIALFLPNTAVFGVYLSELTLHLLNPLWDILVGKSCML
jgi:hypothetical protein